MIDFGLQGRVLYVTGGGSGIGRAIATLAARGGMKVAVADAIAERAQGSPRRCGRRARRRSR